MGGRFWGARFYLGEFRPKCKPFGGGGRGGGGENLIFFSSEFFFKKKGGGVGIIFLGGKKTFLKYQLFFFLRVFFL